MIIILRQGLNTTRKKQKKEGKSLEIKWTTPRSGKGDHGFAQPHSSRSNGLSKNET